MNLTQTLTTMTVLSSAVPVALNWLSSPVTPNIGIHETTNFVERTDLELRLKAATCIYNKHRHVNVEDTDDGTLREFIEALNMTRLILFSLLERLRVLRKQYNNTWLLSNWRYSGREFVGLLTDLKLHDEVLRQRLQLYKVLI